MESSVSNPAHFILLGASLNTGNLGVSALLASTVQCICQAHPDARISLLEGRRNGSPSVVRLPDGSSVELGAIGIRVNKAVWKQNHALRLLLTAALIKLIPAAAWRQRLRRRNPYLKTLTEARMVADITGGDSFSDIYGMRRLSIGFVRKLTVLLCGADLVLLPQTYGPFRSKISQVMARFILARAAAIYSRDRESLEQIRILMGSRRMRAVPKMCPDVAFVLDAIRPDTEEARRLDQLRTDGQTLIGVNVSGLLYHGGYTQDNMFRLACDYPSLVAELIGYFGGLDKVSVLLIPHVVPENFAIENDREACRGVWQTLPPNIREKTIVLDGCYDQNQVKYFVGLCDFFMGARMHATIAALSQCIPAAGMAYSRKFAGVFQTAGMEKAVVDLCVCPTEKAFEQIRTLYEQRTTLQSDLRERIPEMKQQILTLFRNND